MSARLLRALAWLQWRLLVNGLKGAANRDSIEALSRWTGVLGPIVMAVLLVPAALLLAVAGGFAGWALAARPADETVVAFFLTFGFLVPLLWVVLRPLAFAGGERDQPGLLLRLLPLPDLVLHGLELVRAVLDPILLLFGAAAAALPLGVLASGRPGLALVAAAGSASFFGVLVALAAFVNLALRTLMRDRRRSELVALVLFLASLGIGIAPQLLGRGERRGAEPAAQARVRSAERRAPADDRPDQFPRALALLPSGAFACGLTAAAAGRAGEAALELGALTLLAAIGVVGTGALQRRLLETPASAGPRASTRGASASTVRIPGLSPGAAAVAATTLRATLRTVRGKMLVAGPLFGTSLFAVAFRNGGSEAPALLSRPELIAGLGVFIALGNLSALMCNQFAADGPGLALELLQPVAIRELLLGKAVAATALYAAVAGAALLPLPVIVHGLSPALLLAVWLAGLAAALLTAPVNALLAALLPKHMDMAKLGSTGKPHPVASVLSFASQLVALLPGVACLAVAPHLAGGAAAAPLLEVGLVVVAGLAARAALRPVARLVDARAENLVLVTGGR